MSILVKEMKLPEDCQNCPFGDGEVWCKVPGDWRERYYMPKDGRSEYCPLVKVKDEDI